MRILVTGSRTWTDISVIYHAMRELMDEYEYERFTLVHGGADGADTIAAMFASDYAWRIEEYRPQWAVYGRKAGFVRNCEMVDSRPDLVLAFIRDGSLGATQCASYAESKGISVRRFLA